MPIAIAALVATASLALTFLIAGCGPAHRPGTTFVWAVGRSEPRFDPTGPPDPVRRSIETLLSQGLVVEDTTGRIAEGAAHAWEVRPDGLIYTFHLRAGLAFEDGTPCTSTDIRRALESGLSRLDHSGFVWLLSAVAGVDKVRPGRPLPPLGIATPDEHTLVLRLARADPTLLHKLAMAGTSMPWPAGGAAIWRAGTGPYRVASHEPGRRMVLARLRGDGPDTVRIEFGVNAARARTLFRRGHLDLLWPVPPRLLGEPLPGEFHTERRAAHPVRRLWLVLRGDLPPTTRSEARRALAHGLNRPDVLAALDDRATDVGPWPTGGRAIEMPPHDGDEVRVWLDRGHLGRSMHVAMAYAADGAGAEIATPLQNEWARSSLDIELRALRGQAFSAAALARGGAQLLLVESQAPFDDPAAELSVLVEPQRLPPVGGFHTGWRTRDFDRWVGPQPPETPVDLELAAQRLEEDLTAIPLAQLPWIWVERTGGAAVRVHPRYGPGPSVSTTPAGPAHLSR